MSLKAYNGTVSTPYQYYREGLALIKIKTIHIYLVYLHPKLYLKPWAKQNQDWDKQFANDYK